MSLCTDGNPAWGHVSSHDKLLCARSSARGVLCLLSEHRFRMRRCIATPQFPRTTTSVLLMNIDFLSSSHRSPACSHVHGKKASAKRCRSASHFGPRRGRLAPVQTGQDRGYAGCWIQTSGNILENILSRTFVNKAAVETAWDGGYAKRVRPALD